MGDEELASSLPEVIRIDEERLDGVVREAQKADRRIGGGGQDPPRERVAGQLRGDERAERDDVALGEKVMGGADGAFPELEQPLAVVGARASNGNRFRSGRHSVQRRLVGRAASASGRGD